LSNNGFAPVSRDLLESGVITNPNLSQLYLYLCLRACFKPKEVIMGNTTVQLSKGQLITGRHSLSNALKMKPSTVRNCLNLLQELHKIGQQKTNKYSIITVLEQCSTRVNGQQTDNRLTTEQQQTDTNNKENKEKKEIVEIVDYLNKICNKKFSPKTNATIGFINGRLSEGRTIEDFKSVIDKKCLQWINDEKYNKYLRPETLFTPKNFENYLNETKVNGTFQNQSVNRKDERALDAQREAENEFN